MLITLVFTLLMSAAFGASVIHYANSTLVQDEYKNDSENYSL